MIGSRARRVKTRHDATKRDAVQRIALRANMRAEPGGRRPAPPRAEPGGSAADWCRREDHAVARRTEWVCDGVTPPRFWEIGIRIYDEKKRSFLYGQTDMMCLSVTKWTLDVLSIENRKKNLNLLVDM